MGLDIRLPIGLMFSLLGLVLVPTGLADGTTINTYTGSAMLLFGVAMLAMAKRARRAADASIAGLAATSGADDAPHSGTRSRADGVESARRAS